MKKIYYGRAVYDNKEIKAVLNVLKNKSLSLIDGENVKKLEKTVKIGIPTNTEIKRERKNQILIFFVKILFLS